MKRHGLLETRRENQRGLNIMDAVMGMMIAAMVATAVITGLTSWFNTRNLASSQDSATQYAQGIIAKAKVASWGTYGFPGATTTNGPSTTDPKYAFCSTAAYSGPGGFRANVNGEPTVVSSAQPAGVYPVDVVVLRGKPYCVRTDITWSTPPSIGAASANATTSYGVKHISMKLSWQEQGKPKFITIDSTRSPNIGEAIPSSVGINDHPVLPPAVSNQSFDVVAAKYNAVSFAATWKDAVSVKIVSSNAATFSSPTTIYTADPTTNVLTWTKDYGTVVPTNAYYRLVLEDSIGLITNLDAYQFPGSKLTINQTTKQLTWNAYGGLGTPSYNVWMSNDAAFTSPTKIATTSATSYTAPMFTGDRWFRIDTINGEYSMPTPAQSNIAQLTRPLVQPLLTCAPNSYTMDMNVAWQTYSSTWGSDVTAAMTVKNNVSGAITAPVNVTNKNSQLHDIDNAAGGATYLVTMTVTADSGATSSGTVTCSLPKFIPTVTYSPANQQMVVTSNLTFKQLGFGIASPTAYNGTTFTTGFSVKGNEYFNLNKAYPSLDKTVSGTYSAAQAETKPSISQIIPITGGAYIPSMSINLPSGTLTTKVGAAPSTKFPYRDYSNKPDGSHQLGGIQNDALTFYDFNSNTFAASPYSSLGWGWGSAKNLGLGQNTTSYTTSSVWLLWDDGLYRYDMAADGSGNTVGKTKASQGGMDLFNNFTVVQNYFGDERPAILAIANRTAYGWNAGDLMAYKIKVDGDTEPAVLIGTGWKNYTIAPVYDWNGYGTSALMGFKSGDRENVWMYNIAPQGKTPINILNSRTPLANTAGSPSIANMMSIAGAGHDDSGKPVVLLSEGVGPYEVIPGASATPYKYNSMVLDGAGGLGGYYSANAPAAGFESENTMDRRWMQGNFASANNGNYCIDVPNNDGTNGNKIHLYGCNNSSAQEFKWSGDSAIAFRDTLGKCLDVPNNSGSPVQLHAYDCNGSPAQHFKAVDTPVAADLFGIKHVSSGLCIDNANGAAANGNQIRTWECNSSYAQSWGFPWNDNF